MIDFHPSDAGRAARDYYRRYTDGIFEGTQQINLLIVARRILGYGGAELD
jgi:hypothetical protein